MLSEGQCDGIAIGVIGWKPWAALGGVALKRYILVFRCESVDTLVNADPTDAHRKVKHYFLSELVPCN